MVCFKVFFSQSWLSGSYFRVLDLIGRSVRSALLLSCAVLLIFLASCQKTKICEGKKELPLSHARQLYLAAQYKSAGQAFQSYLATSAASHSPALSQEAKFGVLLCRFLSGDTHWLEDAKKWHYEARSYWEGKSFTILEDVVSSKKSYFKTLEEACIKRETYAQFLILRFLIWKQHLQFIEKLVTQLKNDRLAWKLCLLSAWEKLKKSDFLESKKIFQIILYSKVSHQDDKLGARTGLAIIAFLDHDGIPDWGNTEYCIELQQISVTRSQSPFSQCEKQISTFSQKQIAMLTLCDMIFNFAGIAENSPRIWQAGLTFMAKHRQSFSPKIYCLLHDRFILALAWWNLIHGKEKAARSSFEMLLKKDNGVASYQKESALAISLMDWKNGASLDKLAKNLGSYSWTDQYTLAGRTFDFYRLPSRSKQKAVLDKLRRTVSHKIYFTMLDVLCLLGDGRSAYSFLGQIVEKFPQNIQSIYLTEERNIPRNPYAENQIWEKLD